MPDRITKIPVPEASTDVEAHNQNDKTSQRPALPFPVLEDSPISPAG